MGQQRLPELRALIEDRTELLRRKLQDDLEALRLGALAALDEALPYLGVLPHLWGGRGHQGKARAATTFPRALPWLGAQVPPLDRIFLASYTHLPRNLPFLT